MSLTPNSVSYLLYCFVCLCYSTTSQLVVSLSNIPSFSSVTNITKFYLSNRKAVINAMETFSVTGHLKPATCGQFKSGHFEVVS